ncbi:histone acetyltransferase NGG1 ASCRUDRAFT_28220, partial [Ascoidea rubescens DSM 1968]
SVILNKILKEMDLEYDENLGMLDGDLMLRKDISQLKLNTLVNLKNFVELLKKRLSKISSEDSNLILKITDAESNDNQAKKNEIEIKIEETESLDKNTTSESDVANNYNRLSKKTKQDRIKDKIDNDTSLINNDPVNTTYPTDHLIDISHFPDSSHSIKNDSIIEIPKSDFLDPLVLNIAKERLELFDESKYIDNREEYVKKRCGITYYPPNDLKDQLPGEIPDYDFSSMKAPTNQIPYNTFQTYIEAYFRPYTEDDIEFLSKKFVIPDNLLENKNYNPKVSPFITPKLGTLYSKLWTEEDNSFDNNNSNVNKNSTIEDVLRDKLIPKGSSEQLTDELLEKDQVSCGPLVSRLLSAILKLDNNGDNSMNRDNTKDDDSNKDNNNSSNGDNISIFSNDQQNYKLPSIKTDYNSLEERVKRELKYVGVFMNLKNNSINIIEDRVYSDNKNGGKKDEGNEEDFDSLWIKNRQDDEISVELRLLQKKLKVVNKKNNLRKKALIPKINYLLAWQEYYSILEDLSKQVDQAYIKRTKVPKSRRRKGNLTHQQIINNGLRSLLDKRNKWINDIGIIFKSLEETIGIPSESIFDKKIEEINDDNID